MKTRFLFLMAILCWAVPSARSVPREFVEFAEVPVRGAETLEPQGAARPVTPGLEARAATFTGTLGSLGAGYSVGAVRVSGTLTAGFATTFAGEARIWVQPPAPHAGFVIVPFPGEEGGFSSRVIPDAAPLVATLPDGPLPAAGAWTFTFFDARTDAGAAEVPDAVWSQVRITLDDTAPDLPTPAAGAERVTLADVVSDGELDAAANDVRRVTLAGADGQGPYLARGIVINGRLRMPAGGTSFASDAHVAITPPGGERTFVETFNIGSGGGSALVDLPDRRVILFPEPREVGGEWTLRFFETADDPWLDAVWEVFNVSVIRFVQPALPEGGADLGRIWGSRQAGPWPIDAERPVAWFRLDLPEAVNLQSRTFLDIDTEGSVLAPASDTVIALYSAIGQPIAMDDDSGTGELSQLSFGAPARPSPGGDALVLDGRDGSLLPGIYYLAVGSFGTSFAADFAARAPVVENTGVVRVNVLAGSVPRLPAPTPHIEVAALRSPGAATGLVIPATGAWLRLTIPAPVRGGTWLDIDTLGSDLAPYNDTELALFSADGTLIADDDDRADGLLSQLTFGPEASPRQPRGAGEPFDGRNGPLAPGVYYLLVTSRATTFYELAFVSTQSGAPNEGEVFINFRTNIDISCLLADIVAIGGFPPGDGEISVDDYTSFVNAFSVDDLLADIVSIGGFPPPDGALTVDDYTAFINAFGAGCW